MTTLKTYLTGYALSIAMTLAAFGLLWLHTYMNHTSPSHTQLMAAFVVLAILQLVVQLVCFLHIGKKSQTSNLSMLALAIFIVFVVAGGSLWIMTNLNHNMPEPFTDGQITPQTEQ